MLATATDGSSTTQQPGIWVGPPDDLRLVTMTQWPAPGTDGRFSSFTAPRLNNAGQIAFRGFLDIDSGQQLNDVGLWAGSVSDGIQPIALEGQRAAGFDDPTAVFSGSAPGDLLTFDPFGNPVLSGGGHIAFTGSVVADTVDVDHNDGIWISDPLTNSDLPRLNLVAREGDHPPGTPNGTRLEGIAYFDDLIPAFESPLVNKKGQVAFTALTKGPLDELGSGIWATDASGNLHLVAHSGDEFAVGPGDEREIALLKLNPGGSSEEGNLSALNDVGQLVFALSFTDGSEAVVVATIPGSNFAGDFNFDGKLNSLDIDDLTAQAASMTNPLRYDLNADAIVDAADISVWIKDLFHSWIGDANLDRQFNSADLVDLLAAGVYESDVAAVWSTGDFNGSGRFSARDLLEALAEGGYEWGPRPAASVPEPCGLLLLALGLCCLRRAAPDGNPPQS
jgi:hypothetical protein